MALPALESTVNGSFHIGAACETSVLGLVEELSVLAGRKIEPMFAAARVGEIARSALDASKERAEPGWSPKVGLNAGLEQTLRW